MEQEGQEKSFLEENLPLVILLVLYVVFFVISWRLAEIYIWDKTITNCSLASCKLSGEALIARATAQSRGVFAFFGGLIAIIGIHVAWRRVKAADDTIVEQQRGNRESRYNEILKHLESDNYIRQTAGFNELYHFAKEHEDYRENIIEFMYGYLAELKAPPKAPEKLSGTMRLASPYFEEDMKKFEKAKIEQQKVNQARNAAIKERELILRIIKKLEKLRNFQT